MAWRSVSAALLFSTALLALQPVHAQTAAAAAPAATAPLNVAELESYIAETMQAWRVPGAAIAIVKGDDIVFLKGIGHADTASRRPVDPDTLFAAGSTTKAFTSFGVGLLADQGKLTFDTPVVEYLPRFQMADHKATELVTLRDMLSHRTGLPRHDALWYNKNDFALSDLPPLFANLESSAPIRAEWQYNNLMYMTAGYVAQVKSGAASWETFTRDRILTPLGMTRTNFSVERMDNDRNAALAYKLDEARNIVNIPRRNIDAVGPAGSINTSARDMAQWLLVHMNGGKYRGRQIINPATLSDLHSPLIPVGGRPEFKEFSNAFYGMAWMIDNYRGHRRIQHGGNIDGFTARVTFFPDAGIGTVIFMNMQGTPLPAHLSLDIADRQLGLEPVNWARKMLARRNVTEAATDTAKARKDELKVAGTRPAHAIASYAGRYVHPSYGPVTVTGSNGTLAATYNGMAVDLGHWHYEVFNADPRLEQDKGFENLKFQFDTDLKGRVAAVKVELESAVEPIVFRREAEARLSDPAYLRRFVGQYQYLDRTVTVELVGDHLVLDIPGQGRQNLDADIDGSFTLENASSVSVVFNESGNRVSGFALRQPGGIFEVKRLPETTSPPVIEQ
ncbi:MAG: serine hydrolase [Novosphingobium sp.]|nr:serine hydrolase [Novosphingobium sp.]